MSEMENYFEKQTNNSLEIRYSVKLDDNMTLTRQSETPETPLYILVIMTILFVMIFIIGIVGNISTFAVLLWVPDRAKSTNKFLLNLSVADVLALIICMPPVFVEMHSRDVWYFGKAMFYVYDEEALGKSKEYYDEQQTYLRSNHQNDTFLSGKIVPFLENTVANASVLTILAISIERYMVVSTSERKPNDDFPKIWKIVIVIWMISAAVSIPSLFIAVLKPSRHLDGTPIMVCRNPVYLDWHKAYVVCLGVLFFLIPCSILFALYSKLCALLHFSFESDVEDNQNRYSDLKMLRNQVMQILACIVLIFFVCHLPFRLVGIWLTFEDKNVIYGLGLEKYLNILYFSRVMFYMNHALNPIVYNFVSRKFRVAACRLLRSRCRCQCQQNPSRHRSYSFNPHPPAILKNGTCKSQKISAEVAKAPLKHRESIENTSTSSTSRNKINEFYPMYAKIEKTGNDTNVLVPNLCSAGINKSAAWIRLADNNVAITLNFVRKTKKNCEKQTSVFL